MNKVSPDSKDELADALDGLVQRAYRNGVTVDNGGYELTHQDTDLPDWDLTIMRMK